MLAWLRQTVAITLLNLRTVPQRLGSSTVAVVGIAGVVIVFVAVLSIGEGFRATLNAAGSPDRAIVMRSGADSEMMSVLIGPDLDQIKQAPGLARDGTRPLASSELFVVIDVNKISTGTAANVPLRGVDPTAMRVHDEVKIVDGRPFQFGTSEAMVGRAAVAQFEGLAVGSSIRSGETTWSIVGMFESNGSVAETELWCDAAVLQGAYRRGNSFQSSLVRLDSPQSFDAFKDTLTRNPTLNVSVQREQQYYAEQSRTMSQLITTLGYGIAALMGFAAVFGAILTMYTAVATRARQIATLRALGFNQVSVVISVLAESMALAAIGGVLGGLAAYAAFNGYQTATMNWQSFSQVAFRFAVTPSLLAQGLSYALVMGLLGGVFPAIRAARLPIPLALREP
jgi:putative ABC transport system permease protein